jgi:hypothetical protein
MSFNEKQRKKRAKPTDAPTSSSAGRTTTETLPKCPICLEEFTTLSRAYTV